MREAARPWLAWPGGAHLRLAASLALVGGVWFAFVYGGANWLTARRTSWWVVHLEAEKQMPFVPEMIVIYVSLYSLFVLAPFIVRNRRELQSLAVSCNLAIFVAGLSFILVPAELVYPPHREFGAFSELFQAADALNLTYNLVPSLHVTFAVLLGAAVARPASRAGRVLIWAWIAAIAASTLLTHQHHAIDVITGAMLGFALYRWLYRPRVAPDRISRMET